LILVGATPVLCDPPEPIESQPVRRQKPSNDHATTKHRVGIWRRNFVIRFLGISESTLAKEEQTETQQKKKSMKRNGLKLPGSSNQIKQEEKRRPVMAGIKEVKYVASAERSVQMIATSHKFIDTIVAKRA
jgi:hypothetical protein